MAAQLPLQYHLASNEDLETRLASKGLKVVEVFSEWSGPCRSVLPTFKRIRIDKDDESCLQFITMPAEKCELVEAIKEHRGKSEPLFLFFRNGQLKGRVHGADTPTLSSQIQELTPANADVDDLQENPVYLAKKQRERNGGAHDDGKGKKKK